MYMGCLGILRVDLALYCTSDVAVAAADVAAAVVAATDVAVAAAAVGAAAVGSGTVVGMDPAVAV